MIVCLEYCSSLYQGLPMKSIKTLQLAHNSAAGFITLTSRFEHISPILKQLHWLPIHKRCQFKILVFVYKSLHTSAPSYQCKLLNWYQPPRSLRSASITSLVLNKNKTVRYGRRLLDSSAATLIWCKYFLNSAFEHVYYLITRFLYYIYYIIYSYFH